VQTGCAGVFSRKQQRALSTTGISVCLSLQTSKTQKLKKMIINFFLGNNDNQTGQGKRSVHQQPSVTM